MKFDLQTALPVLERTPQVLKVLLSGLPDEWVKATEGPDTWSPFDVVGHLLHGERTDWIPRLHIIMSDGENKTFTPFDRFAQFEESKGKTMNELLDEFAGARRQNLEILRQANIHASDLSRTAIHPALGPVNLRNMLSTWVAHDLNHTGQVVRVMAKQYKEETGPWGEYLRVMKG